MEQRVSQLHTMDDDQARRLCGELREELLRVVSRTGGHLASNLGSVELTVALHRVFDFRRDRLVFDVGHQCYTHKLLSGRGARMDTLRAFGGLSGFPKPGESEQDAFIAGHASNSVSVALGMARARTLRREDYHVLALLGDGALTGGLAYEGLSDAGQSGEALLVVLNDNGMSIAPNVGGVARHLARQRLKPQYLQCKQCYRKVMSVLPGGRAVYRFTHRLKTMLKESLLPCSMFEDMGFAYMGPVDGHDVAELTRLLRYIQDNLTGPVLLHVKTTKGKGYPPAERDPDAYHGVAPFALETGEPLKPSGESFSSVFGRTLCALAGEHPELCAVTAAMQGGTGLNSFARAYPGRCFDVGIAEGHAAAMAAGMAKQGARPVFAVYSTFLQRAYDMLLHDVAIQHLPVLLCVDRAGLVGEDGETHHGLYDVAYLSAIPGMEIWTPASFRELESMLRRAVEQPRGPMAIRYPRGGEVAGYAEDHSRGSYAVLARGRELTLVTYGTMTGIALEAARELAGLGRSVGVVKLNRLTGLEQGLLDSLGERVLLAEEASASGGVGEKLAARLALEVGPRRKLTCLNTGERFLPQGSVSQLRALCGLDRESLVKRALEVMEDG